MTLTLTSLRRRRAEGGTEPAALPVPAPAPLPADVAGCTAIADLRWREPVRVVGRIRSIRVQPRANVPTLECTLVDGSGGITVVFLGRRRVPGLNLGTRVLVEGRAGAHHGKLAVLNPEYTLLAP